MISRKDKKGRKLKDNETLRTDGRYCYRYTDTKTGRRRYVYAKDLPELRMKEKEIDSDKEDSILTDAYIKKLTLNELFDTYISTKQLADSTRTNYTNIWNNKVKDALGYMKVVCILSSDIKKYYAQLSKAGYSHSTIKIIHNLIYPTLEMAIDDDIIRKNPSKRTLGDYGEQAKDKQALTVSQQEKFLNYIKNSNVYNIYYPMFVIMVETGLRCGELIGLTWDDIDTKNKNICIDHQLTYKNYGDGCKFHITSPKTDAGVRKIPMTANVKKAFDKQREYNFMLGIDRNISVDGYSGFIFVAKTGRPLMPSGVNNVLYNIVNSYNQTEIIKAKKERRKVELLPRFSAHILRHTACTRMAEKGVDIKVIQYIMGHSSIEITMEVYNHIEDMGRVQKEISKLENVVNY